MTKNPFKRPNKKVTIKLPRRINFRSFRLLISVSLFLSVVLFAGSSYFWYKNILANGDRIFEGMLAQSLQTDSVIRTVKQDDSQKNVEQSYYVSFKPDATVQSRTVIEQIGQDRQKTVVVTDSVGTKDADFVKYSNIQIPSSKSDTSQVLNQWAKRTADPKTGQSTQFLTEAAFMFVPFGNLSNSDRAELTKLIKDKKVYSYKQKGGIDYGRVRPTATYHVTIKPKALVEVLAVYVKKTGIGDPALLNPEEYEDSSNINVEMTIDVLNRHLTKVVFVGDARTETFTSYGLNRKIELPTKTITIDELQTRLQTIQ